MKGKSIRKEEMEGAFETLLQRLVPAAPMVAMARTMFESAWNQLADRHTTSARAAQQRLNEIDRRIETTTERLADASVPAIIKAYETQIVKLSQERGGHSRVNRPRGPATGPI